MGWNPGGPGGAGALVGEALLAMVLGTVAFGGIGLVLAGTLKPLVNLAVVNALFVVLLLLGGMLIPLAKLPTWLADVSRCCRPPPCPRRCTGPSATAPRWRRGDWVVLVVWAVAAPVVAALLPLGVAGPAAGRAAAGRSAAAGEAVDPAVELGLGHRPDDVADHRARLVDEEGVRARR